MPRWQHCHLAQWSHRSYPAPVKAAKSLVVLAVLVAGCTTAPTGTPSPTSSAGSASAAPIVRVKYEMRLNGKQLSSQEFVTDGVRTRSSYVVPDGKREKTWFTVADGVTEATCEPNGCRRGPDERPSLPGSPQFERSCPQAKQTSTGELLGRPTTVWSCAGTGSQLSDVVRDAEFPFIVLSATPANGYPPLTATSFEAGVTVPPDYFSLDGPDVTFIAARPATVTPLKPGQPGTVMPKLGGGEVRLTDYTKGPAILVLGDQDGIRSGLARMQRVTGGTLPTVIAVADAPGPDSEPAEPFPVPVALDDGTGKLWYELAAGQSRPLALFCQAAATTCTAVGVWDLSDAELAAEIAKVG